MKDDHFKQSDIKHIAYHGNINCQHTSFRISIPELFKSDINVELNEHSHIQQYRIKRMLNHIT